MLTSSKHHSPKLQCACHLYVYERLLSEIGSPVNQKENMFKPGSINDHIVMINEVMMSRIELFKTFNIHVETHLVTYANSADSVPTPQNAASCQDLHCL